MTLSLRSFSLLLALLGLSACATSVPQFGIDGEKAGAIAPLLETELADGRIMVASPPGYCIDPLTVSDSFVLIAACQFLADGTIRRPAEAALITVTLGADAKISDLPSPEGLALLSEAPFLEGQERRGLVTARLAEGGDLVFPGSDKRYWRGAMLQNGRMLGLALYAPKDSPLAEASPQGERLLRRLMERIVFLSPTQRAPEPAATSRN